MRVGDIYELNLVAVNDRGVPNKECIVIGVNEFVNIGQFGILLGIRQGEFALPIRDNLYWFGDGYLNYGDRIFLYTGLGESRTSEMPNTTNKIYALHWGRPITILGQPEVVPVLFRVDAVNILTSPLKLPYAEAQNT